MGVGQVISLVFTILTKMPDLIPLIKGIIEFFKWAVDLFKENDEKFAIPKDTPEDRKATVRDIKIASFDNAVKVRLKSMYGIDATPQQVEKIREVVNRTANPKFKFEGGRKP